MSNKGITLVALVITIIVLLILAGVSISLVVGDNGIMTRAKTAGEKTNEADAVESFKLAVASLTSEYFAESYTGTTTTTLPADVSTYVATNMNTELGTMDYELAGSTDPKMDGEKSTTDKTATVKVKKKNSDDSTAIEISYTITTSGNISNIKAKEKTE